MNNLGKIVLLPAREQVASVLRKAILSKELEKGQEITLEGIASQVGVSSMPVREAFQILASDGLIKLRPNKGAVVLGINKKTIKDHFETRAILESEAAARASAAEADIAGIENAYNLSTQAQRINNYNEYSAHNQAFHMAIWKAADNAKMTSILSSLWNGLAMGNDVTEEDYAKVSIKEHGLILDAIKAHDAAKAKELMYKHTIRSMDDMMTHYNSQ